MHITTEIKYKNLINALSGVKRLALAFSGGVDSSFLLKAAVEALGPDNVLALTAKAPLFPARETNEAHELAGLLSVRQLTVDFKALEIELICENQVDRCYHCKYALFQELREVASEHGFSRLADGANVDDLSDYRPGSRATAELGIASPLQDAGLSKAEVRFLSQKLGLTTWDKPAYACLASRFPYRHRIDAAKLLMVEKAEAFIMSRGFREVRVRHHGEIARIEIGAEERPLFFDESLMALVEQELKALGFAFVTLDLSGYRRGSLNYQVEEAKPD